MFELATLFGPELKSKSGVAPTVTAFPDVDVVGIYFSAHWCPPCRGFTPKLGEFYDKVKALKKLEIVFVSSDRDESQFDSYYDEQASWLALPYAARSEKEALFKKYKVSGIPSLVLIDAKTGATITADASGNVREDLEAAEFPWCPPTLPELLATLPAFKTKADSAVPLASLEGPLLLYFSAHWCPPCKAFTPELGKFFTTLKAAHPSANLVFVSSDRDEGAFDEYYAEMGEEWLAMPFSARPEKEALSKFFKVEGIPSLVLLDAVKDGSRSVVTTSARSCVSEGIVEGFPASWGPKPYGDLSKTFECCGSDVNETKAFAVLCEAMDDGDAADAVKALKAVATAVDEARQDGADPEVLYFFATQGDGPVGQVRNLCGVVPTKDGLATFLLLDIPDKGFYLNVTGDVTPESIANFIANPGQLLPFASRK